jgi:rhodanese-related sulfurtransferase
MPEPPQIGPIRLIGPINPSFAPPTPLLRHDCQTASPGVPYPPMTLTIDPNIPMAELEQRMPGARRALFRRYHIGGCASCGFRPEETLASVCARNENLPVEEVIEHLVASQEADLKMTVSPLELQALRAEDPQSVKLLDVRTREEFEAVHIEGSILFSQDLMQEILAKWDRQGLLVFIDHQGARSMDAAAYFAGHGFENARCLRGGIDAWSVEAEPSLPRYELE